MITRASKIMLVSGTALLYTFVVFNNLTDFDSNYQFVRHVLSMDSTFPGNHGRWRAIQWPTAHLVFYVSIIAWEVATTLLLWWGTARLIRARSQPSIQFHRAKGIAILGLTASMLMFLVAFLSVGAEWFLMWQSHGWNGQDAAFRMFALAGLVLIYLVQPDAEPGP
jgi:predicted small integral membrane protein